MIVSEWRRWLDREFGRGKRAPYRRRGRQPMVEALEPRWVPSFTGVTPKTIAPTETIAFSGTVASFTTDTPGDAFLATIDWGDGTTTAGLITGTGVNSFDVSGSHTYAEDGANAVTVSLTETGTSPDTATAGSTANVTEGFFALSGVAPITVTEGQSFSGTVATISDPGSPDAASAFSATIDWGDGTTDTGTITGVTGSGEFTVTGSHTYADELTGNIEVTVTEGTFFTIGPNPDSVTVAEADVLTVNPIQPTLSATEGQSFSGRVANFVNTNAAANTPGDFTATIDWGDGTTTAGTVSNPAATNIYAVDGSHTYADEGTFTVTVTLADDAPGTASATATSTITVTEGDLGSLLSQTITPTEGTAFSGAVASFTDEGNPSQVASDFTATIDWGDGTTTTGTVTGSTGGPFTISGDHTYADEGTFTVIASFSDDPPSTLTGIAITSSAVVSEADTLSATATPVSGTEGVTLTDVQVATFTDTNLANTAGDFTATIFWGDATESPGTVSGSAGNFTVTGTHTYFDEGTFSPTVFISDDAPGSASTSAVGTATIAENDTLTGAVAAISTTEGTPFSGTVATFTDTTYPSNPATDFGATIDWGDGTTTSGTVLGAGGGTFAVSGSHTYADEGTFSVTVVLTDDAPGTATSTATGTATVTEGDFGSLLPMTITPTEGTAFSGAVASFTDPGNPSQVASDWTATIDWGDGTTTAGTVSGATGGPFTISGSHTYVDEGTFAVIATVSDDPPSTLTGITITSSAVVSEADVLSAVAASITATEGASFSAAVATFSDTNTANVASDFTAIIDWGDGTITAGTVSGGSGSFTVSGDHTYAEDGSFPASVVLSDDAPGTASATATTTAIVAEDTFVASAMPVNGFERTALSDITVATFTHANGTEPTSTFTATINWGDGTSSAGTVTQTIPGGEYTVTGSHTYLDEPNPAVSPTFAVTVSITDDTGSTTANTTATILEELLPGGIRGTTNQRWLSEVYRDLLSRQIDAGGLSFWNNALNQGMTRVQVAQEIETSPEYVSDEVQALYNQYLHRPADPSGLANGVAFLQSGGTVEQLAASIAGSPEYFQNRGGGTNDGFLAALYQDALGRPIDSSGAAFFGAALANGVSRTQVAASILSSQEYHQFLITTYYNNLLDRPTDPASAGWVNALNLGARDESIIASIVSSIEFYDKTVP